MNFSNGQTTTLSNSHISSTTNQVSKKSHEYSKVTNLFLYQPQTYPILKLKQNFYELPPRKNEVGYCNQLLYSSRILDSAELSCQDAAHTQIEDVAAQLGQLASDKKLQVHPQALWHVMRLLLTIFLLYNTTETTFNKERIPEKDENPTHQDIGWKMEPTVVSY
ncbi:Methylcytosine dioxygenase TET1 [Plecturocebus cupreus]